MEQTEPISEAEQIELLKGQLEASKEVNRLLNEENKWMSDRYAEMVKDLEQVFGTTLDYVILEDRTVFVGDNTPKSLAQEMMILRKNLEWEVRELRKLCKEASHLTCQFYDKRWQDWMKNWNQIKDVTYEKSKGQQAQ